MVSSVIWRNRYRVPPYADYWAHLERLNRLKAEVDAFAKAHGQGTSVGNTLIRRYVGSDQFVRPAIARDEMEKFDKVVGLFRGEEDRCRERNSFRESN